MIKAWMENRERVNTAIDDFFIGIAVDFHQFFVNCGKTCIFFFESCALIFRRPFRLEEITKHLEFVGNKSVIIIMMTSMFTGLALSYQIYLGFKLVNATNLV